jgi:transglutaminase-like putative cysteine protease
MIRVRFRSVLLDVALLAAWLATAGMVLLHEQGSWWSGGSFLSSLVAPLEAKEQWFGIYYRGQKLGFASTMLVPEEQHGMPGVGITDRGQLFFNLLGQPQQLHIFAKAFVDADWRLQAFTATVQSPASQLSWSGRRMGEELAVTVSTPQSSLTKRLRDPTGSAFVNGLSSWAAFHRLREGQSGQAWVLNPLSLNPEIVYYHVRRTEVVEGQAALVVESEVAGLATTSWVTPDGEVVKEASPLGWELRREPMKQALQMPSELDAAALDLLSASAVEVDRTLESPERIAQLTLLLEGVSAEAITIRRPWQTLLPEDAVPEAERAALTAPWCAIRLARPSPPTPEPIAPEPAVQRYQRPTPFVQSDDPRMLAAARAAAGDQPTRWGQALALQRWVFAVMRKQLTVGLPSALDVLATPVGDCHEHTVLFTALARSLGLPTRMVAGLVYWHDRLYYHAWPEVWIGDWIPTDPTLNQPLADATHLGFIEAENETLISLTQFIGRLRARVLAVAFEAEGSSP